MEQDFATLEAGEAKFAIVAAHGDVVAMAGL